MEFWVSSLNWEWSHVSLDRCPRPAIIFLQLYLETRDKEKPEQIKARQTGNVENFLVVYLNAVSPSSSIQRELRGAVNTVTIFDDTDDCLALINTVVNEHVILIVSDALGDPFVSTIQELDQVFTIYILCETDEQVEQWSTNQAKIRGIDTDVHQIIEQIRHDIDRYEQTLLTFTYSPLSTNSKDQTAFVQRELIKELLLNPDEMGSTKAEMIEFCRSEYRDNAEQLAMIEQFDREFDKDKPMALFNRQSFLSKVSRSSSRKKERKAFFSLI